MKLTVVLGPAETRTFLVEGDDLDEVRRLAEEQVPEGWRLVSLTTL
ncbi:hypothetical protein [Mycetocola reblochoni]|uniref:Uncharacterized protein n=1 Tax=Mycetocola reblochoni REB411 TaxID=1255698 RepID=A0A1R4KCP7_9MICO|nr:hypothetical protein [Mycetocola reblochoni]SJN42018.1 hypothetical protein FM119_13025 [Mycetocola reblochoni REB411]